MTQKMPFISQTAKDYDMKYEDVERIYNYYPDTFYEKLEEFIADRRKKGEN